MEKQFIAIVVLDDNSKHRVYDNQGKGIFKTEAEVVQAIADHKAYCKGSGMVVGSLKMSLDSEIDILGYEIKSREVTPFEIIKTI